MDFILMTIVMRALTPNIFLFSRFFLRRGSKR